ncbi:ATP-binding cassette domain-containing protein, partial [Patescibacteria group bacterium]|nr:ATP-binding cassette domain-containing protein [Patescibacteria group bacterium]
NLNKQFKIRTNKNIITGLFNPKFQFVDAVNNVSFEVNEGDSLAFLGPNGAGKTTTTKMLTGLIYPSSGTAEVLGYTPSDRKKEFLMQIGLVMGGKSGLSWDLTAEQSFDFIRKIYGLEGPAYKNTLDKLTEILDVRRHLNKQIRKLSLGERMKMELIGAILHNPKVLFLDEPTIGLDITSKKNIRGFLREIQRDSNITLILTSHDMDDVEKVCDRVVVINKGHKVYDDSLDTLVGKYNKKKYIKFFLDNGSDNLKFDYAEQVSRGSDSVLFEVEKENTSRLISEVLEKGNILDIDIVSVPLEEMIEDIFEKTSTVSTITEG